MIIFIPVLVLLYVLPPPQHAAPEGEDSTKPEQAASTYG